jgi:hypothetical protein
MEKNVTRYRKTTLVDAIQTFRGEDGYADWSRDDEPEWIQEALKYGKLFKDGRHGRMRIRLKEGIVDLHPGSWIVRGANGAIWPLDNNSFLESYEQVD